MTAPRLAPGDRAPAFTLPDASGRDVSLSDFAGRRLVVFVYPAAGTPGCTKEACDFQAALPDLEGAGFAVVGLSPDPPAALAAFAAAQGLTFPLLSDPSREVLAAYGAYGAKKLYGKTVEGVIRSTFVLDEQGVVVSAAYGVKATGHVGRLTRDLGVPAA